MPPIMDANDNGIANCDIGMLMRVVQDARTGIMAATNGVFAMNADTRATGAKKRSCAMKWLLGRPSSRRVM
jgi:hypothetical protein